MPGVNPKAMRQLLKSVEQGKPVRRIKISSNPYRKMGENPENKAQSMKQDIQDFSKSVIQHFDKDMEWVEIGHGSEYLHEHFEGEHDCVGDYFRLKHVLPRTLNFEEAKPLMKSLLSDELKESGFTEKDLFQIIDAGGIDAKFDATLDSGDGELTVQELTNFFQQADHCHSANTGKFGVITAKEMNQYFKTAGGELDPKRFQVIRSGMKSIDDF